MTPDLDALERAGSDPHSVAAFVDGLMAEASPEFIATLAHQALKRVRELSQELDATRRAAEAALGEAREVVAPFATEAAQWSETATDTDAVYIGDQETTAEESNVTVGDLRRARAWLSQNPAPATKNEGE